MAKQHVPRVFRAMDFENVKVGRACTSPKAHAIADNFHHQQQWRRKLGHVGAYQVDESEVSSPSRYAASTADYTWRYLPSYGCRYVRVGVLTLGATGPTPTVATQQALLNASSTTDAGADFAHVAQQAAPAGTLDVQALNYYSKILQVAPGSGAPAYEDVIITQGADVANTKVRILSLAMEEFPLATIDPTVDTWAINKANYTPGDDIIDTEYDDLPIACQILRRTHKKAFSLCKEMQTNSAAFVDLVTKSGANLLQYDLDLSVNLPETANTAVQVRALASSTDTAGTVRFAFGGTNLDLTINNAAPTWFATTGTITKGTDTVSFQGKDDAGTLVVYQLEVYETNEAT